MNIGDTVKMYLQPRSLHRSVMTPQRRLCGKCRKYRGTDRHLWHLQIPARIRELQGSALGRLEDRSLEYDGGLGTDALNSSLQVGL